MKKNFFIVFFISIFLFSNFVVSQTICTQGQGKQDSSIGCSFTDNCPSNSSILNTNVSCLAQVTPLGSCTLLCSIGNSCVPCNDITITTDGTHTLFIVPTKPDSESPGDFLYNVFQNSLRMITIDKTPPTQPDPLAFIDFGDEIIINWGASSDATSGIDYYNINMSTSSGEQQVGTSTTNSFTYSNRPTVNTTFFIYPVDKAGNIGTKRNGTFVPDSTSYVDKIGYLCDPSIVGYYGQIAQQCELINSDCIAQGSGTTISSGGFVNENVNCQINSTPTDASANCTQYCTLNNSCVSCSSIITNDGTYSFQAIYGEKINNQLLGDVFYYHNINNFFSKTFTIDRVPPTNPGAITFTKQGSSLRIDWGLSTDATSGILNYVLENDSGTGFQTLTTTSSINYTLFPEPSSSMDFRVKAVDRAGNESNYTTATFTPTNGGPNDITPPTLNVNVPSGWQNSNVTATFSCTDETGGSGCDNSTLRYSLNGGSFTNAPNVAITTEGITFLTVRVEDNANNMSESNISVKIDKSAPSSPQNFSGAPGDSQILVSWSAASDTISNVVQYIIHSREEGQTISTQQTSTGLSLILNGLTNEIPYYFDIQAQDETGNLSPLQGEISVTPISSDVDATPPVTTAQYNSDWTNQDIIITLTCQDLSSGCLETKYNLSIIANNFTYLSPFTMFADTINEGIVNLQYWSTDNQSNTETPKTGEIKIDITAPVKPNAPTVTEQPGEILIQWIAQTDSLSGVKSYHVYKDSIEVAETSQTQYIDSTITIGDSYNYQIAVEDNAGNLSVLSDITSITVSALIDNVEPITTISHQDGWYDTTLNITLTCSDAHSSCLETRYGIDNSNPNNVGTTFTLSSQTEYVIYYQSEDVSGNIENVKSVTIGIDLTAPSTPTSLSISDNADATRLSWSASTDVYSGIDKYVIERNGLELGQTFSTTFNDLTTSNSVVYTYRVKALDEAGNESNWSNEISTTIENLDDDSGSGDEDGTEGQEPETLLATDPISEAPDDITGYIFEGKITIVWGLIIPDNVKYFEVLRSENSSEFEIVSQTRNTFYEDLDLNLESIYEYKIRVVDLLKRKSKLSDGLLLPYKKKNFRQQSSQIEIYHLEYGPTGDLFEAQTLTILALAHSKKSNDLEYYWKFGDGTLQSGEGLETIRHNYYLPENLNTKTYLVSVKGYDGTSTSNPKTLGVKVNSADLKAKMQSPKTNSEKPNLKNTQTEFEFILLNKKNNQLEKEAIKIVQANTQSKVIPLNILDTGLINGSLFIGSGNVSPIDYIKLFGVSNDSLGEGKIITYFPFYLEPVKINSQIENRIFYLGQLLNNIKIDFSLGTIKAIPNKVNVKVLSLEGEEQRKFNFENNSFSIERPAKREDLKTPVIISFNGKDIYGNLINDSKIKLDIRKDNPDFDLIIKSPKFTENSAFNYTQPIKISAVILSKGKESIADKVYTEYLGKKILMQYDSKTKEYFTTINLPSTSSRLKNFTITLISEKTKDSETLLDFEEIEITITDIALINIIDNSQFITDNKTKIEFNANYADGSPIKKEELNLEIKINNSLITAKGFKTSDGLYSIDFDESFQAGATNVEIKVLEDFTAKDSKQYLVFPPATLAVLILAFLLAIGLIFLAKQITKSTKEKKDIEIQNKEEKQVLIRLTQSLKNEYLRRNISETEYRERLVDVLEKIKKLEKKEKKNPVSGLLAKLKAKK